MSILKFPVEFEGDLGEGRFETLFDSGANLSCINPEVAHQIASFNKLHRSKRLLTASENHFIEVNSRVTLDFYLDEVIEPAYNMLFLSHSQRHLYQLQEYHNILFLLLFLIFVCSYHLN